MYLNSVRIIGNLTRDPELKALPSGVQVASFSVATNETFTKDGQKQEKVEYHNVVVFGKTAENVAKYMSKGSQIMVEGKLQTRSWDKDGVKMYRTEIIASPFGIQFGNKPQGSQSQASASTSSSDDGVPEYPEEEINPEDIPF